MTDNHIDQRGMTSDPAPPYSGSDSIELQDLQSQASSQFAIGSLAVHPQATGKQLVTPSQGTQERYVPPREDLPPTGFYLNRRNSKFLGAILVILLLLSIAGWSLFGVENARKERVPEFRNITFSQTSTIVQSKTLTQVNTMTRNFSLSFAQIVTSTSTQQASTVTQTSLVTVTPSAIPNSTVQDCWGLLNAICTNITEVPTDQSSGLFGDCEPIFQYFYCGVISILARTGEMIIPVDTSPECGGMHNFCVSVGLGTSNNGSE